MGVNATDRICIPQTRQKPAAVVVTPNQDEDWEELDKQVTGLSYWRRDGGLSWKLPLSGWLQATTALCELDSSVYKYRYLPHLLFRRQKGFTLQKLVFSALAPLHRMYPSSVILSLKPLLTVRK